MRAFINIFSCQIGGRGEKSRVPSHDNPDQHTGERAIVQIEANERLRDKSRSGTETGAMIVKEKVIIYGLGNMDSAELVTSLLCLVVNDAQGI